MLLVQIMPIEWEWVSLPASDHKWPLVTIQLTRWNLQKRLKIDDIQDTSSTVLWCSWYVWVSEKSLEKVYARYSTQIQNMSAKAESIQLFN